MLERFSMIDRLERIEWTAEERLALIGTLSQALLTTPHPTNLIEPIYAVAKWPADFLRKHATWVQRHIESAIKIIVGVSPARADSLRPYGAAFVSGIRRPFLRAVNRSNAKR